MVRVAWYFTRESGENPLERSSVLQIRFGLFNNKNNLPSIDILAILNHISFFHIRIAFCLAARSLKFSKWYSFASLVQIEGQLCADRRLHHAIYAAEIAFSPTLIFGVVVRLSNHILIKNPNQKEYFKWCFVHVMFFGLTELLMNFPCIIVIIENGIGCIGHWKFSFQCCLIGSDESHSGWISTLRSPISIAI